jgi:LPXTG-motif cell wall-anchored protein
MAGVAMLGMVASMFLASAASAQTTTTVQTAPAPPGQCVFNVIPDTVTVFPADVEVKGTAPVGTTVTVFVNGTAVSGKTALIGAGGTFDFTGVHVTSANDAITVNFTFGNKNAYTATCATPLGEVVVRVKVEAAAALAFTGSSNTGTYVLIGIGAVVLGLVLVVGARRRASVRS